jgi:isopenicillin N synthase-like dioxygenase
MSVVLVDIGSFFNATPRARKVMARTVDRALHDNGFLLVGGHDVPADLVASLVEASRAFFALPPHEKAAVAQPTPRTQRGYVAMGRESLAGSRDRAAPPDLNESFMMGQPDVRRRGSASAPNLWPAAPTDMRAVWTRYYREMERLAAALLRMFAVALGGVETLFDEKFAFHTSRLRARYYPGQTAEPRAGQLRAGAHTDFGSLAILLAEDRPGGLQVRERSGMWVDVPAVPGHFIVNVGDLMARWTNDRWPAALHRVVNPPRDRAVESGRLSHIFFHSPAEDAVVECLEVCCDASRPPNYMPVRAAEYLQSKFEKVHAG